MTISEYWEEYERRVQIYEEEGCTRSDAQSVVDVEMKSQKELIKTEL